MSARPVERLSEVILGRRCGCGFTLQQLKLAPYAQQLGNLPVFFGLLGLRDRLLDLGESVGDLPSTAQGFYRQQGVDPQGGPSRLLKNTR